MALREPGAGELNRRITLRLRSDIPTPDEGLDSTFAEEKRRWAKIEPVSSATYSAGVQIDAKVTHRITLYYLEVVGESHEVLHGSKLYRVQRVTDMNGSHRFTVLDVEELGQVQAGGGLYG
ncbi:phage head closure protein [Pseudomonas sp. NPDC090755]|uniref:phage head closure protein n=1 Tax=Pseudomonas sp. NPDC090755 TaxID=3364481 RepID=UPI00383A220E